MNVFTLSGILLCVVSTFLTIVVWKHRKTKIHSIWAFFNLSVAVWGGGSVFIGQAPSPALALLAWRIAHIGIIFTSATFFHTATIFCDNQRKLKPYILFAYIQSAFFVAVNATGFFIAKVRFVFNSFYYAENLHSCWGAKISGTSCYHICFPNNCVYSPRNRYLVPLL